MALQSSIGLKRINPSLETRLFNGYGAPRVIAVNGQTHEGRKLS